MSTSKSNFLWGYIERVCVIGWVRVLEIFGTDVELDLSLKKTKCPCKLNYVVDGLWSFNLERGLLDIMHANVFLFFE